MPSIAKPINRKSKKKELEKNMKKYTCFRCEREFTESGFYMSHSNFFHHIPICKECLCNLFDHYTELYVSIAKAMVQICSVTDMYYNKKLLDDSIEKNKNKNGENASIVKSYIRQINSLQQYSGLTFKDSNIQNNNNIEELNVTSIKEDELRWGMNYSQEEYLYLNAKYDEWCETSPHDLLSDISILRDICKQELTLSQDASNNKALELKIKLIKMGGLDGETRRKDKTDDTKDKQLDCIIEIMETTMPADFWDDKDKYNDFMGYDEYYKNNYIRPMKNVCVGKKDFPKIR